MKCKITHVSSIKKADPQNLLYQYIFSQTMKINALEDKNAVYYNVCEYTNEKEST